MTSPRIAIFYDWLNQYGGAEKVLKDILTIFPDSDLFTLVYDPEKTKWLPQKHRVFSSSLKNSLIYTPIYSHAIEKFNLSDYDIIISTTSTIGHSFLTNPKQLFICYFHNINRYLYQTPPAYRLLSPLLKFYQNIDFIYSRRPDYLFCNSKTVQNRIQSIYKRHADIINPGINTDFFVPSKNKCNNYYLTVSRLVKHKNIDLAITACAQKNLPLVIVGQGREEYYLQKLIKKTKRHNIKIIGSVSSKKLLSLYQNCRAVICPQNEDFGIVQIEAQACGKPVVGLNLGGNTETVIPGITGYLFDNPTADDLISALDLLDKHPLTPSDCRQNALRFSERSFMLHFKQAVDLLWMQKLKTII